MTSSDLLLQKALIASDIDSSQWNRIQAGLKNRAFVLSRVTQVNLLSAIRERVAEYSKGTSDLSKIRMEFRKELEKGVRVNMLVNQACAHVPDPTEEEVAAFYEAHKAEYVAEPQVLCQHILVKGADDAALDKIKSIRERIVSDKADFAEEARKHSDCPSGAQGGSLGWFGRGMMVPEFDKAAFGMKKGEVSDIVMTEFGYHIIYKADERGGGQQTIVDVHDQIKDLLRHEARGKAMDAYVADLREKATIQYKDVKHECSCGHHH